jgi:hypothetical protein
MNLSSITDVKWNEKDIQKLLYCGNTLWERKTENVKYTEYNTDRLDTDIELKYYSAVVYNDQIHLIGKNSYVTQHTIFDGTSWSYGTNFNYGPGVAAVYNGKIHNMNGYGWYSYDGSSWSSEGSVPYPCSQAAIGVYDNEIHIMGSITSEYGKKHYKYDGSSWSEDTYWLPGQNTGGGNIVKYKGKIYYGNMEWDGTRITVLGDHLIRSSCYNDIIYNGYLYIFADDLASGTIGLFNAIFRYDGSNLEFIGRTPYSMQKALTVLYNNKIHIIGKNDVLASSHYMLNI